MLVLKAIFEEIEGAVSVFAARNLAARLLQTQFFFGIAEQIYYTMLTFFLWKTTGLRTTLFFFAIATIAHIVATIPVGYLIDRSSSTRIYQTGLFLGIVQATTIFLFQNSLTDVLVPLALVSGTITACIATPLTSMNRGIGTQDESGHFYARKSTLQQLIALLFPIMSGYLVTQMGYSILFGIWVIVGIIAFISSIHLPNTRSMNPYKLLPVFFSLRRSLGINAHVQFFWGVEAAMVGTMIPIATVLILGSVSAWGIFTSLLCVIAIIVSSWYATSDKYTSEPSTVILISTLLSSLGLTLAATQHFLSFVLFLVILRVWNTIQVTSMASLLNRGIEQESLRDEETEYSVVTWILFLSGRFVSFIVLLALSSSLESITSIGILFCALGVIVLQQQKATKLSRLFQHSL